jgi:hypothetical protein
VDRGPERAVVQSGERKDFVCRGVIRDREDRANGAVEGGGGSALVIGGSGAGQDKSGNA